MITVISCYPTMNMSNTVVTTCGTTAWGHSAQAPCAVGMVAQQPEKTASQPSPSSKRGAPPDAPPGKGPPGSLRSPQGAMHQPPYL